MKIIFFSIFIVILFLNLKLVEASIFFEDGFESGTLDPPDPWTGYRVGSGQTDCGTGKPCPLPQVPNILEIVSSPSPVHDGTYSLHCLARNFSSSNQCSVYYDLPSNESVVYASFYVYFKNLPDKGPPDSSPEQIRVFGLAGTNAEIARIYIANRSVQFGSPEILEVVFYTWHWNESQRKQIQTAAEYNFVTNQWYFIEFKHVYSETNGEYRVWVNGEELPFSLWPNTGLNTTINGYPKRFYFGGLRPDMDDFELYIDDVKITDTYIEPYFMVKGKLKDRNNNPLNANVTLCRANTNNIVSYTQTSLDGTYSLSVPLGVYDVEYNISNFYIDNFFIKLLSVNVNSEIHDLVNYVTGDPSLNKIAFMVDITENQIIQTYSPSKPSKVLLNKTNTTEVPSLELLEPKKWFFNSNEKKLFILTTPKQYLLPWLHVDGIWIKDEAGNRIQLRGAGMTYNGYDSMNRAKGYIDVLASKGLNLVRLAFNHPLYRTRKGTLPLYNPQQMDEILDYAEAHGIYAILDNHQYWAPDWYDEPKPSTPEEWKQAWIDMWVEIATRYANRSSVLGYELNNEPYGTMFGNYSFPEVAIPAIEAIRKVDQNHIIFLAEYYGWWYTWVEGDIYPGRRFWIPPGYVGIAGVPGSGTVIPNDTNIVFHMHHWSGALTGGAATAADDDRSLYYDEASEYVYFMRFLRETFQRPIWAGEFGAYNQTPGGNDMEHAKDIMRMCEDAGIMWTAWMMEKGYDWDFWIPEPYTTTIIPSDVPRPFVPKPFNMLEYTIGWNRRGIGYNRWGSSFYQLPSGAWVTFKGPSKVELVKWANMTDFYNMIVYSKEIISIPQSGLTITNNWPEFTRIFAYESL